MLFFSLCGVHFNWMINLCVCACVLLLLCRSLFFLEKLVKLICCLSTRYSNLENHTLLYTVILHIVAVWEIERKGGGRESSIHCTRDLDLVWKTIITQIFINNLKEANKHDICGDIWEIWGLYINAYIRTLMMINSIFLSAKSTLTIEIDNPGLYCQ